MAREGAAPSREALAAIAAAYRVLASRVSATPATASRWRLAARLGVSDAPRARNVARNASRWSAAGRLDD